MNEAKLENSLIKRKNAIKNEMNYLDKAESIINKYKSDSTKSEKQVGRGLI